MPILAALALAVQVGFAIHCVKTGRDRQWLYFIIFVPLIGGLVYFFTQVLPDLQDSRTVRHAVGSLARAVDPHGELRRRKEELEISDNVDNRVRLADECMDAGFFAEAEELFASCLTRPHAEDPNIMLKVAEAQFAQDRHADARQTLESIVERNPEYRSTSGHLLYARALEALDDPAASDEYEVLLQSYPGEEARIRYAQLLERRGQDERARQLYQETLTRARHSPKYYRRAEKAWIDMAARKTRD